MIHTIQIKNFATRLRFRNKVAWLQSFYTALCIRDL